MDSFDYRIRNDWGIQKLLPFIDTDGCLPQYGRDRPRTKQRFGLIHVKKTHRLASRRQLQRKINRDFRFSRARFA